MNRTGQPNKRLVQTAQCAAARPNVGLASAVAHFTPPTLPSHWWGLRPDKPGCAPTPPSQLAGLNPKCEPWRALPLGFPMFVREGQGIVRHSTIVDSTSAVATPR